VRVVCEAPVLAQPTP